MREPTATNVLFVDDEPQVLEGLKLALRRDPYNVFCAGSGREALTLLGQRDFAALVSDDRMPGMTGSELLTLVRRRHPSTARILLTGQPSLEAAIHCINEGRVARFLQKPCSREMLVAVIAQAIRDQAAEVAALKTLSGQQTPPINGASDGAFTAEQIDLLSSREREVFDLVAAGWRLSQISRRLFISGHTVRSHIKAIFAKLAVHSQAELLEKSGRR